MNAEEIISKRRVAYKKLLDAASTREVMNKIIRKARKELEALDQFIIKNG